MNSIFVLCLASILFTILVLGFRYLPKERWQVLAAVPTKKGIDNNWETMTFTWYGAITSFANVFSLLLFLVLMISINARVWNILLFMVFMLPICLFSTRLVARIVEGKKYTSTIAGAVFVGFILAVPTLFLMNAIGFDLPILESMSALLIAYIMGECIGRLSCISFGCCYGKKVSESPVLLKPIFERLYFIFEGNNKKVSYEGHLMGEKVIPIQAITSILFFTVGLISIHLFLGSHFTLAFVLSGIVSQCWRLVSELFRADFRGNSKFTVYQKFSIILSVLIVILSYFLAPSANLNVDIRNALEVIWDPAVIIGSIIMWCLVFVYTGKSMVLSSKMTLSVKDEVLQH